MKYLPLLLLASALPSSAAVLYSETFGHQGGGSEVSTDVVGWTSYYTSTAIAITSPTAAPRMAIGNQAGSDAGAGYLFSQGDGISHTYVGYESTDVISIVPTNITTITFMQGNSDASLATRILIQQSGNWYATNSAFSTASMTLPLFQTGSGELETFNFSLAASSWRAVTINPGVALSLAGTTIGSDLSATAPITSIGFLTTSVSAVTRIDEVKINGILEPSLTTLLGAGAIFALRRRRVRGIS